VEPLESEDNAGYRSEPEEGDPWKKVVPPPRPASTNPFVNHTHESINMSQLLHYKLPPDTCFETAFTSESPTTRVVHTGTLKFCKNRYILASASNTRLKKIFSII